MRRRALLLSAAGALPLLGCGKSNTATLAPAPEVPFLSSEACLVDITAQASRAAAATTSDGESYAWTELVAHNPYSNVPFPDMDGSALLSFNGHLWLIGGWNPKGWNNFSFEKNTTNAVWRSADGISWVNVKPDTYNTPSFNPQTDWEGRHVFGCVAFNGRMWIIGGDDVRGRTLEPQKDIWSSADGVAWRKEGDLPFVYGGTPSTRMLAYAVVFKDEIYLLGGQKNSHEVYVALDEIWKSKDGKTWQQVAVNGRHWSPRMCSQIVVYQNRLWILGGGWFEPYRLANWGQPGSGGFNDVWSTADGVNWIEHLPDEPESTSRWGPRAWGEAAVFDNKMWVFSGGVWGIGNVSDVWSSADGVSWTRFPHEIPPRHASGVTVHGNTLRVVTGNMWNDSWMLGPYVWERVAQNGSSHFGAIQGGQAAVSNLSETDPKVWLLGAGNCIYSNAVWVTADGSNWALVKDNSYLKGLFDEQKDWAGRHMQSAVYFDNAIWVVGGSNKHTGHLDDVWRSTDGANWSRLAAGVACLKRVFHSVLVFKEQMWVLGGQSTFDGASHLTQQGVPIYYNDVWRSSDGVTWTRVLASAPWAARGQMGSAVVHKDRIWVIGGGRQPAQGNAAASHNDVWSSADGLNWTQHTAQAPWAARRGHQQCVFDKRIWVIGGWDDRLENGSGGHARDMWYSADGADWVQLPVPGKDVSGTDCAMAVLAGVPHIIGGPSANDVWRLKRRDGQV